ncbi:MAG: hypothetical protein RXQ22_08685 [Sulfolobus sp.]
MELFLLTLLENNTSFALSSSIGVETTTAVMFFDYIALAPVAFILLFKGIK